MKLTITHKISLLSSLLVALTAGAVAFAFYVNTSNTMAKHALEDLSVHTRNEGEHFLGKIEEIIKDIHFLSNMPPIQELMRTNHSIVYDKNGGASQVQWEQRLATIFSTLMHAHPDYMQVRFLDAQGYEQVRVERNQTGSIENISNNHLQYKGDTDYVKQTTRLQKNKIYLSEINLNREHGKVMIPHTPVLRAATPVYNNSGKLFGIVIINLNLKNEFKRLYHHHQQQGHTLYMMNDKGEFLIHPDKEKRFTFDLGNKHKSQFEFPHLVQFFMPENKESIIIKQIALDNASIASVFVKIPLPIENENRYVVMGMTLPYEEIIAAQKSALSEIILLSVLLIFIGLTLAYAFSAKVVQPIKQISSVIDDFMHGKKNHELPIEKDDELGLLARTFETLIRQVADNKKLMSQLTKSLEKKVSLRTRELSRFKTTLDLIHDCVLIFDPDTLKFIYVNHGATELIKYSSDKLLTMTLVDLQTALDENEFKDAFDPLINGKESHITYQTMLVTQYNEHVPVEFFIQYVTPTGEKPRFVIIAHDISQRKDVENKILLAKEIAENANKSKSEFLARMSHELRTPMNAILGFSQLMKDDEDIPLHETHKMYSEEIINAGYHLLALINEVLDLSQIESGNISIKAELFDCCMVIEECVSLIQPLTSREKISLEYNNANNISVILNNDKQRFKEILINLLTNAVKYNRPQGKVTIELKESSDNRIHISITDTGKGLTAEQQQHLFNPFDRIGAEYSNIEGTGIGLVIVKRLIDSMGGNIGCESTPDIGTTFWIEFDLAKEIVTNEKPARKASIQQLYPGENEKKFKVLYVEDNKANLQLVEHALKKYKAIKIITTMTPKDGLLKAEKEKPDLILMDIDLPEMDGFEALKRLRTNPQTKTIPVVAISAYSSTEDLIKGEQAGFNDYLTKPIELQQLYHTVDHFLPVAREQKNKIN